MTFLFTDVEGSTELVQRLGAESDAVIERQAEIVKDAVVQHGGTVIRTEGDGVFAAFPEAVAAVRASIAAQKALTAEGWSHGEPIRVRMGLHTGEGRLGGDDYLGIDVHQAARIAAAAHGEQVVLSEATKGLVEPALETGASFVDLGTHELRGLPRPVRIHQITFDGARTDFPPLRATGGKPNNLPAELTSFVGREDELHAVVALLGSCRLVTLTGPGGTGKSRLGLRAAARAADSFGGVYFVPLAPLAHADLVSAAISTTIGLTDPVEDPEQRLRSYLADKDWLLLLDNFEHVLEAAPLIAEILTAAPRMRVLVTSRAPLRIEGEREYPVPPLAVPGHEAVQVEELANASAVQLFVERAQATKADFRLTETNAPAVAELTARLDGLPLALELAATWLRLLPLDAIVERLSGERGLDVGGRRDVPERQRTLRTAIRWSYDLLDPDVQRLFERLSVFAGGADFDAVEAVAEPGDLLSQLEALVDHSLVRAFDTSGLQRFSMLETIRQFATERLAEQGAAAEVKDAHLRHFRDVAVETGPQLLGQERSRALSRLDREIDNIRAALAWAIGTRQPDEAAAIIGAIWRYWHMRGSILEGRELAERVSSLADQSDRARVEALEAAGGLAYWHSDFEAALNCYQEAVEVAERLDDPSVLANAHYNLSFPLLFQSRSDGALAELETALGIYREISDDRGVAKVLWGIGTTEWERMDLDAALASFQETLKILERLGDDVFQLGWTIRMIGSTLLGQGKAADARPYVERGMALFSEVGDASGIAYHVRDFSELALLEGEYERSLVLAAAVRAAVDSSGLDLVLEDRNELPDLNSARAVLGQARAQELAALGRSLDLEQATAYAIGELDLEL